MVKIEDINVLSDLTNVWENQHLAGRCTFTSTSVSAEEPTMRSFFSVVLVLFAAVLSASGDNLGYGN